MCVKLVLTRVVTIQRVGKVVGVPTEVTKNFNRNVLQCDVNYGTHKVASTQRDQRMILDEVLNRACVFDNIANWEHQNFKDFVNKPSIILQVKAKDLAAWIMDHSHNKY